MTNRFTDHLITSGLPSCALLHTKVCCKVSISTDLPNMYLSVFVSLLNRLCHTYEFLIRIMTLKSDKH